MTPSACIVVSGWGAVSPAGWGSEALLAACGVGVEPLPAEFWEREGQARPARVRRVPKPALVPEAWREPRLRRTSLIGRYAASAALEALDRSGRAAAVREGTWRLGILFTAVNGCVEFSRRFFSEVLREPSLASPILFPETVFNAPASHLSAVLGSPHANLTLLGDSAQYACAMETGVRWLLRGEVDGCLVVGAEEADWLTAEGARWFDDATPCAEGAGAVYLERRGGPPSPGTLLLDRLADVRTYSARVPRCEALAAVRTELECGLEGTGASLLCDGLTGHAPRDREEKAVWDHWTGERMSVRAALGDGFAAATAWQVVLALGWLAAPGCGGRNALVSAAGENSAATGVRFARV